MRVFTKMLREELAKMHGPDVELFSREVVFDYKYLNFRTLSDRVLGDDKFMNIGECLAYTLISDKERAQIFTSQYDLGNFTTLESSQMRQGKIVEYLRTLNLSTSADDESKIKSVENIEDVVKAVKRVICDLTGHNFRNYRGECIGNPDAQVNASYATKVLCTLYRYRLQWPKVFNRFDKPASPERANLELRDAYPLPGYDDIPKEGVSIYSDLKLSLTHGMSAEERTTLLPAVQRIADRYARSVFVSSTWLVLYEANAILNKLALNKARIEQELPLGNRTLPERLDKSVYVWLVLREVEHRAVGKQFLNDFLMSDKGMVPLMPNWSQTARDAIFEAIPRRDIKGFRSAIRKITGQNYTDDEFERANDLHECLNWIIKNPLMMDTRYNHLEAVAAIITCLGREADKVRCRAYWYGKKTTSDRPVHYLENIKGFEDVNHTPEFYLEYWFRRYMLVLARLVGEERIWRQCNQLEQFECERVTQLFKTHSFDKAIELVSAYYDRVTDLIT